MTGAGTGVACDGHNLRDMLPHARISPRYYRDAVTKSAFKLRPFGYDLRNFRLFNAWEEIQTASMPGKSGA